MSGTLIAPPPSSPSSRPCPTSSSHAPPSEASASPAPSMAAPNTTVWRMPMRSAIQPKASAPVPEPSHAREFASAGTERVLPRSAAIGLRATTATRGAPYENVNMNSTTPAASHDLPVSTLWAAAACAARASPVGVERATPSSLLAPVAQHVRCAAIHLTSRTGIVDDGCCDRDREIEHLSARLQVVGAWLRLESRRPWKARHSSAFCASGADGASCARFAVFSATAARMSACNAFSLILSPSRISMARLTLPSRLELNRPEGSSSAAPLAKVSFTTVLYVSPVQMMPSCSHTGTPSIAFDGFLHFTSSTTSGSACLMIFRTRASTSPRQSPSAAMRASIRWEGEVAASALFALARGLFHGVVVARRSLQSSLLQSCITLGLAFGYIRARRTQCVGWVRPKAVTQHSRERQLMLGYALRANPTYEAHIRSPGNRLACFTQAASWASSSSSPSWMSR